MLVEFLDKTVLTLGPDARLIIDTFVYDPKSGAGTSVYKLTVGTFRFISGKMNHANVRIVTPSAIIGIRGSDAVITVSPEGATTVDVLAGEFEVSNDDGGDPTTVSPAQSISVSTVGVVGAVTPGITTPNVHAPTAWASVPPQAAAAFPAMVSPILKTPAAAMTAVATTAAETAAAAPDRDINNSLQQSGPVHIDKGVIPRSDDRDP